MAGSSDVLEVYTHYGNEPVASIVLNGYNITLTKLFGQYSVLRSFQIVSGNLHEPWSSQESLLLRSADGQEVQGRVAALPVEVDSLGLMEFLPQA